MSDKQPEKFEIEFIDPLFAVAIHLGLAEGIFQERWFHAFAFPTVQEWERIAVFGLGMLTLVLAWLGYHRSIIRRPVRGFGRFIIDIALVMLYGALLVKYRDLEACLLILTVIYFLYALWDLFKSIEYRDEYKGPQPRWQRYGREFVTLVWLCAFLSLWLGFRAQMISGSVALLGAYLSTIAHRVNKVVPIWSSLGRSIARTFVHGTRP